MLTFYLCVRFVVLGKWLFVGFLLRTCMPCLKVCLPQPQLQACLEESFALANPCIRLMINYHVFLLFVLRSSLVAAGFPQSRRIRTGALGSRSRFQPIAGVRLRARARRQNVVSGVPLSDDKLLGCDAELRRKSRVNTWSTNHARVFPLETPFPLVKGFMMLIVLQLRKSGYRSAHNYLASARRHHLELDHAWKPSLDIEYREAALVARRGLGPSKKA